MKEQIDYKKYARQMRENCVKDYNGNIICSAELWEELASTIERLAGYRKQSEGEWRWISDDCVMCNRCRKTFDSDDYADAWTFKFCPECGAHM